MSVYGIPVATFSIVAFDPANGDLGVAVQSRFLAVGSIVPWARSGVGAIAVQAFPDPRQGPQGLELMAAGSSAAEALQTMMNSDPDRSVRQMGAVDRHGRSASYTGSDCLGWAGQITGDNFAAQGNMLVSESPVTAMAEVFDKAPGELTDRLMAALAAAQQAGGDARGKQSAGLLVVREGSGFRGSGDQYFNLRVDDHPDPITELSRLVELQRTIHLCFDSIKLATEGKFDDSVKVMHEAERREPTNVNVLYFLARAYMTAGRKKEAQEILTRASALHPNIALLASRDKLFANA